MGAPRIATPASGCCVGHLCDGCAKCLAGRCCRRDNPGYVLPDVGTWPDPIFGEIGSLPEVNGLLTCHICGQGYRRPYSHLLAHDVTAAEYRAYFGLARQNPLNAWELRERHAAVMRQMLAADEDWGERFANQARASRQEWTTEQRSATFGRRTIRKEVRDSPSFSPPPVSMKEPATHCVNGHELTAENLRRRGDGARQCLLCHRQKRRADRIARSPGGVPRVANANKTHCVRGHELTGDNLIEHPRPDGRTHRECRTCRNVRDRARRKSPTDQHHRDPGAMSDQQTSRGLPNDELR